MRDRCLLPSQKGQSVAKLTEDDLKRYFEEAERNIIKTQLTRAKDGPLHKTSQWASWKSGSEGINPSNYGALRPFLAAVDRLQDSALQQAADVWVVKHAKDFIRCFKDTMDGQGEPPGEGSMVLGGKCVSWDSDIHRHIDPSGLCDAISHKRLIQAGLPVDRLRRVLSDWGDWIIKTRWFSMYRRQHRLSLPILSLASIGKALQDRKYVEGAKAIFWMGWGDHATRFVAGAQGPLHIWDTGKPGDTDVDFHGRGFGREDVSSAPWYDGNFAHAVSTLWPQLEPDDFVKNALVDRMMETSGWYVPGICPVIQEPRFALPIVNTKLQGGKWQKAGDPRVRAGDPDLMPVDAWFGLDEKDLYWRLGGVEMHESLKGYGDEHWVEDGTKIATREHHQGRLDGPRLQMHGSCWGIVPVLAMRWVRTQKEEDRLQAVRAAFDYCAFANRNFNGFLGSKSMRDTSPFTSNTGMSRGGAWWLLASYLVRKVILT